MYFIPFFSFEKIGRETRRFYFLQNFFFYLCFFFTKNKFDFQICWVSFFPFLARIKNNRLSWLEKLGSDRHRIRNNQIFVFVFFLSSSSLIFVVYNGSRAAMQYQTVITIWYSGSTIAAWNFDLDHRLFPADDLCLVWVDFEPPEKIIGKIWVFFSWN